jgi:hypothetical protein
MKAEINTKIKVFPKLYVGLKRQFIYDPTLKVREETTKLGFATPLEDNAAFRKRKETVDSWATPHSDWDPVTRKNIPAKKLDPITVDNVPVEGFKITSDVRRVYWGGGNVVWRVEDPRGYELEISSENLFAIMHAVGIQPGGLIPGKCVWARDGANNVLLHETTEEFKTAYKVGETKSPKGTKLGPEHIGCLVQMSGGYSGIYLGAGACVKHNIYGSGCNFGGNWVYEPTAYHFFKDTEKNYAGKRQLTVYRDPKPLVIGEKVEDLTDAAALKLINNSKNSFVGASIGYGTKFSSVTRAKKIKSVKLRLEPVSTDYAMNALEYEAQYGYPKLQLRELLIGERNGQLFALQGNAASVAHYYGYNRPTRLPKLTLQLPVVVVADGYVKSTGSSHAFVFEDAPLLFSANSKEAEEMERRLEVELNGLEAIYRVVPETTS